MDNPLVFPSNYVEQYGDNAGKLMVAGGIRLRDYVAIKSLSGTRPGKMFTDEEVKEIVREAYRLADAVLVVREERHGE